MWLAAHRLRPQGLAAFRLKLGDPGGQGAPASAERPPQAESRDPVLARKVVDRILGEPEIGCYGRSSIKQIGLLVFRVSHGFASVRKCRMKCRIHMPPAPANPLETPDTIDATRTGERHKKNPTRVVKPLCGKALRVAGGCLVPMPTQSPKALFLNGFAVDLA
jgi:hypothetical protein